MHATAHGQTWCADHVLTPCASVRVTYSIGRANTIVSDPQDLETEKSHLTQALKTCGYSQWAINKATCPRSPNNKPSTGAKSKGLVVLPYIKDLLEALRRIFMSHDIFSCTR
ncbi:hypothetical protein Bbelb_429100 [Branchiostoma belcheri]|nr:hypothetical protein Bbelb_429100 [Branchiostoma belcheri]